MVGYDKDIYPELKSESEFNEYILPIIEGIKHLTITGEIVSQSKNDFINIEETYPYHNSCLFFVDNIWKKLWNDKLNNLLFDSEDFKEAICESLAQVAFTYFIRCFANQIKEYSTNTDIKKNYKEYSRFLIDNCFKNFSSEYPVIWYRCNKLVINKVNYIIIVLNTLTKSRDKIQNKFKISKQLRVKNILMDGDSHNCGKTVSTIIFENGEKLIFKPRTVDGEYGYAKLVNELNMAFKTNFLAVDTLKVGKYGFCSFVEIDDSSIDMVKAGKLACLLYLLNATDMHYSNIYWTKEGPIPIDLETLFHVPRLKKGLEESQKSAYKYIEQSVYSTGVLPINLVSKNGTVDVGFTGVRNSNSIGPIKSIELLDGFTSNIRFIWGKYPSTTNMKNNISENLQIFQNCDEVSKGFSEMYELVFNNKEWFLNTVSKIFSNSKVRYIHNMTYRYEQILRTLTSTKASKSESLSKSILSRLGVLSLTCEKPIIISECQQIWNGDVPYFIANYSENYIYDYDEKIIARTNSSPKSNFEDKIKSLSIKDLNEQLKIIKLAFVAKVQDPHGENAEAFKLKNSLKTSNEIIKLLSDKLMNSVYDDKYEHLPKTWIGPVSTHTTNGWTPGVLGYDMYGGRTGIALVLALAGTKLGETRYSDLAFQIFEAYAKILESNVYETRSILSSGIGLYSGFPSVIWGLYEASHIFKEEKWKKIAIDSWKIIDEEICSVKSGFFDMMSGNSATIIMRLKMDKEFQLNNYQIELFISEALKVLENRNERTTSGLVHGISHLIWFFSIMYQTYPTAAVRELINDCLKILKENYYSEKEEINIYERTDYQSDSWCNGVSGVLLAYYEGFKAGIVDKKDVSLLLQQLKRLRITTLPVYCHGILGILEVLNYMKSDFLEDVSSILFMADFKGDFSNVIYHYFKSEKGRYTLSPGFMSGISGAVYYLCKLNIDFKISPITLEKHYEDEKKTNSNTANCAN